jgi:hypothetical protein
VLAGSVLSSRAETKASRGYAEMLFRSLTGYAGA